MPALKFFFGQIHDNNTADVFEPLTDAGYKLAGPAQGSEEDAIVFIIGRARSFGTRVEQYRYSIDDGPQKSVKVVTLTPAINVGADDVGKVVRVDTENGVATLQEFLPRPTGLIVRLAGGNLRSPSTVDVAMLPDPLAAARLQVKALETEREELKNALAFAPARARPGAGPAPEPVLQRPVGAPESWTPYQFREETRGTMGERGKFAHLNEANVEIGRLRDHVLELHNAYPNVGRPFVKVGWAPLARGYESGPGAHKRGLAGAYPSLSCANEEVGLLRDYIHKFDELRVSAMKSKTEALSARGQLIEARVEAEKQAAAKAKEAYAAGVKDGRQQLADEIGKAHAKLDQLFDNPNGVGGNDFGTLRLSPLFR